LLQALYLRVCGEHPTFTQMQAWEVITWSSMPGDRRSTTYWSGTRSNMAVDKNEIECFEGAASAALALLPLRRGI
jgi:Tfp pilus assembly protein PilV